MRSRKLDCGDKPTSDPGKILKFEAAERREEPDSSVFESQVSKSLENPRGDETILVEVEVARQDGEKRKEREIFGGWARSAGSDQADLI